MFDQNGREVDEFLPITVIVEDKNDNAPEFTGGRVFTVEERCRAGKETFSPIKSRSYRTSHQIQKLEIRIFWKLCKACFLDH